jgi:hypothetical protein
MPAMIAGMTAAAILTLLGVKMWDLLFSTYLYPYPWGRW